MPTDLHTPGGVYDFAYFQNFGPPAQVAGTFSLCLEFLFLLYFLTLGIMNDGISFTSV